MLYSNNTTKANRDEWSSEFNEEKYDLHSWQGRIKLKIFKLQKINRRVGKQSTSEHQKHKQKHKKVAIMCAQKHKHFVFIKQQVATKLQQRVASVNRHTIASQTQAHTHTYLYTYKCQPLNVAYA